MYYLLIYLIRVQNKLEKYQKVNQSQHLEQNVKPLLSVKENNLSKNLIFNTLIKITTE